jgi:hypothetical protein
MSSYEPNPGVQRVVAAKANGDVFEMWWGMAGGQFKMSSAKVTNLGSGIVGMSSYEPNPGVQRVVAAKANGDVFEMWWNDETQ